MTPKEIAEALVAVHAALVEKREVQPWIEPHMRLDQSGKCSIPLYGKMEVSGSSIIATASGETFEYVLANAFLLIAEMPDSAEAAKRKFQKNLADVIDEGNGLNLPADVMAPLNGSMKALSENLLTHQPEAAQ